MKYTVARIRALIRRLKGPVKCARQDGAKIGKGFSQMGGDFWVGTLFDYNKR